MRRAVQHTILLLMMAACVSAQACGSKEEQKKEEETFIQPAVKSKVPWKESGMESKTYICNGDLQIGVDLDRGGAIFHFSESVTRKNLLNHADEGRFIQQSYYGDADGSTWAGSNWTWNPIQGGGSDGTKARVISKEITEDRIVVVTEPVSWGAIGGSCPRMTDCEMKEVITLHEDGYAILDFTFTYNGDHDHAARHQEVPAFFCDFDLSQYTLYDGEKPWTGDALTYIDPKILTGISNPNPISKRTEEWSAYVNKNYWGIGLYTPGTVDAVYYRAGGGPGGASSSSCSYFAPVRTMAVKAGMVFNYRAYLCIGKIDDIRKTFYKIHESLK